MRSIRRRFRVRGFTLVELMIVVAIIGVLAALAIYGVRRYLASAKTSEAKNTIGAISRASQAAYERENAASEEIPEGTESKGASHSLCGSATTVPANVPAGKKYQPLTTNGKDYDSGDMTTGWKCLKFSMTQPHYYQYHYSKNAAAANSTNPAKCAANCYEAQAVGDLDGDTVTAQFSQTGIITNGELKKATQIHIKDEYE
ncbi:MAG: type II secretion system protein [Deltaproteobacteria bacterium]|nr:type II secretion system protein [Deltaproteobacteria bacterium]